MLRTPFGAPSLPLCLLPLSSLLLDGSKVKVLANGGVLLIVDVALERRVEADEVEAQVQELVSHHLQAALQQHGVLPIARRGHLFFFFEGG